MQLQALFQVNELLDRKGATGEVTGQIVKLNAVYDPNPDGPNHAFWKATPSGSLEMQINNPAAFGALPPGKKVLLTFEVVE